MQRAAQAAAVGGELPSTVVVLRFSSLGDIVLTSPAVDALRRAWPQARVVFATKQAFAPIAARLPGVSEVVGLGANESLRAFRARLLQTHAALTDVRGERDERGERDVQGELAVLDLHGKLRSILLRGIAPRRRRAVWQKRAWRDTVAVRVLRRPYQAPMHIAARYHQAVERLVGHGCARGRLGFSVDPSEARAMSVLFAQQGIGPDTPLVGISPGALWETKRWPATHFAELTRRVLAAGVRVCLTGSANEAPLTASIAAAAPGAIDLGARLGLGALAALIDRCRVFVANDSGPMHLARALRVPTVAFFGSTDPGQFDFTGHGLRFLGLECSPCSFHGLRACPRGHMRCLSGVDVQTTWDLLAPWLHRATRVDPVVG